MTRRSGLLQATSPASFAFSRAIDPGCSTKPLRNGKDCDSLVSPRRQQLTPAGPARPLP